MAKVSGNSVWKLQENVLEQADLAELAEFIKTTSRFTQFTQVAAFEEMWSRWQGCRHSVFVNSGSSANLVMLNMMKQRHGWQDGDEVLVAAVTWVTNIAPVIQCGLKPVFVDINLDDFAFDYEDLKRKITPRTRAIFLTHLLGFPADMDRIAALRAGTEIQLLEDCCESHGAMHKGRKVGNFGACSSFSFYWGHHITSVEGGMVCTDDEALHHLALLKRSHGLARELPPAEHARHARAHPKIDFNFLFLTDGFNVRNTEFNAVLGASQLRKLDTYIETRNRNHRAFLALLAPFEEHVHRPERPGLSSFCLPFVFRSAERKARFQRLLEPLGIEFRPIVGGNLLRQPCFAAYGRPEDFPNAEYLHTNAFYIGNNQFVGPERLTLLRGPLEEACA